MTTIDFADIQGNIARGYRFPRYRQLFGTIGDDVAQWKKFLGSLERGYVTDEERARRGPSAAVNVGISYTGLAALAPQVSGDSKLEERFGAFVAGMSARAATLGDYLANEVLRLWDRRHVWISIYDAEPEADQSHQDLLTEIVDLARTFGLVLDDSSTTGAVLTRLGKRIEHFGFRDGISNPVFRGSKSNRPLPGNGKKDEDGSWVPIATGEFLLGYENEQRVDPLKNMSESTRELLANGTFAVLRVLEQDVAGFRLYVDEAQRRFSSQQGIPDIAEKMVGRTRDGVPLAAPSEVNDFDYATDDPHGAGCPIGAHIRRSNPRRGGEHRLLRRSIPYGAYLDPEHPTEEARGIYFIAYSASIENQFEFLQRFYMNGLGGGTQQISMVSDSSDPLAASGSGSRRFAIEGDQAQGHSPILLLDVPEFVTCRGGQYYFVPSRSSLRILSGGSRESQVPSGRRIIQNEEARP
jgi:Dyp-type peroxidase family